MASASELELERVLKQLHEKDLRIQCRRRGLSPAGGREALRERVKEHMLETRDFTLLNEDGTPLSIIASTAGVTEEHVVNNYQRAQGQNVGNFITDRPSSRVLQTPGGTSNVFLGGPEPAAPTYAPAHVPAPINTSIPEQISQAPADPGSPYGEVTAGAAGVSAQNNYHRPGGQNVGNFMTGRSSTRVVAPPGGATSIQFG